MLAKEIWDTLSQIDVSNHVEKKGNLSYLSWAWAWGVLMKHYPDTNYEFEMEKFDDGTVEVRVVVAITQDENTVMRTMWLPVLDFKNKAITNPNSFDINKSKMRCLTKCLAMFGLGHYIYAGEDLPEIDESKVIDDNQVNVIYDLIEKTNSDSEKFLKAFRIHCVEDMPSQAFQKAFDLLQKKLKNAGK